MFLAGCEVLTIVGWNPTSGNQPISICLFSYNGEVTIGLCTDDELIPDPGSVAHCLSTELASEGLLRPT
jgi:diacylglycerol O-acyltransferase